MAKRPHKIKKREGNKSGNIRSRDESSDPPYMDEPPAFSLKYIQQAYCISKCGKEDQIAFLKAMFKRKETSWSHLSSCDRHGLGYEKIHRLNVQIPKVAEGKAIIAFRFSGKKPMVGFRERDIFYVLWIDRDFSVYDHG